MVLFNGVLSTPGGADDQSKGEVPRPAGQINPSELASLAGDDLKGPPEGTMNAVVGADDPTKAPLQQSVAKGDNIKADQSSNTVTKPLSPADVPFLFVCVWHGAPLSS